jgi:hypothetical protein
MFAIVDNIPLMIFASNFTKYFVNVIIFFEGVGDQSSMVNHHVGVLSLTNSTSFSLIINPSLFTNNPLSIDNSLPTNHSSSFNDPLLTNWSI